MPIRISREHKGDLLLECARLHYIDKLNKTEIAARLQISGTHVARLLREAEAAGIVESPSGCRQIMTNSKPSCRIVLGSWP